MDLQMCSALVIKCHVDLGQTQQQEFASPIPDIHLLAGGCRQL